MAHPIRQGCSKVLVESVSKIGIYDVDSKIPNLALMKLARHHRQLGDQVEMYLSLSRGDYDKVYASKVFSFSDDSLLDDDMVIGGTGWDKAIELPAEIEALQPDYSLYGYPHNIGFTMRGCRLKCSFCVVPEKEGGPKPNNTIAEIWQQRESDFVMLLDNDFFGNPEWPARVNELHKYGLKVNFSQGLNIRNLTDDQAAALAGLKFTNPNRTKRQVYFAWDDPRHEKLIHRGIDRCVKAGIKPSQMAFYVLIGYQSTEAQDLHRVEVLRSYGCDPYAMPYNKSDPYQFRFTRWVNRKAVFKSVSWAEYAGSIKKASISKDQISLFDVN